LDPLKQLAIIWCGVFVAGVLANKTRLTSVLYFLAFGALMVNIGVLPRESTPFIRGFADLGIVLIMFALGFEENTRNFLRSIKRTWGIAFFGAVAPFFTAYFVADYFWGETNISIMCGLTMTATAVSLTMVSLKSLGLQTSNAATGIMTSAVLDDIAALALVAILVPIATGQSEVGLMAVLLSVGKALLFFGGIAVAGGWLLPHDISARWVSHVPLIGKYGAKNLLSISGGEHSTLTVLLMAVIVGILAHQFGFHPAVGAYMAGLILREEYFLFQTSHAHSAYTQTKVVVDNVAFSWIGPVFFVDLGTKIVFDADMIIAIIPQTIALTVGLFTAQILSASLAARYTGRFEWPESVMIGLGMLGRAELAFVVMDIAYIQNNILNDEAFYTLMATAFFLNVAVPITITLWKPYYDRALQQIAAAKHEQSTGPP
jgi:Kef-type K+ transport system membrane component KefB